MKLCLASSLVTVSILAACSGDPAGNSGGSAGTAGVGVGGSTGGTSILPQGGSLATAGTMQGGASGSAPVGGSMATGGAAGSTSGGAGGAGGSGGAAGGSGGSGGGDVGVPAGCTADPHPICIDFESGIDKATWTGGTDGGVSTVDKAHGTHSYHAYPNAGVLTTNKFGTITNVLWGRYYLRMTPGPKPVPPNTPGAPGGHGNIVAAYEGSNWYELGWQMNGLMGVWHNAGGENPLRSHPDIMDQWYCVELLFDGTKEKTMPKWYVDGKEVEYYMGEPNNKNQPVLITKFDKLTVGFTSYAGLGIAKEPYGNNNDPKMTDMWLDDIAFDTKRIGCIAGPVGQ